MGGVFDPSHVGERIWITNIRSHLRLDSALKAGFVSLRGRYDKTNLFAFEVEWETYSGGTAKTWELSGLLQYTAMYKEYVKIHGIRPHPGDATMEDDSQDKGSENREVSNESRTEGDDEDNLDSDDSEGHGSAYQMYSLLF